MLYNKSSMTSATVQKSRIKLKNNKDKIKSDKEKQ